MNFDETIDELLGYEDYALGVARSLSRGEHDARDVVQDAWRAILGNPPRHAGNLRAYLGTVVRRMAGKHRRVLHRDPLTDLGSGWLEEHSHGRCQGAPGGASEELQEVIERLPEPYRSTILLYFGSGLSIGEIAQAHGCKRTTVRTRKQRALLLLRDRILTAFKQTREADWLDAS